MLMRSNPVGRLKFNGRNGLCVCALYIYARTFLHEQERARLSVAPKKTGQITKIAWAHGIPNARETMADI